MSDNFIKTIKKCLHSDRMKDILCISVSVLVLWLVMYPEYSITAGCCRIVDENGEETEVDLSDRELALAVMNADEDQIVIKSKIWEMITHRSDTNDNGKNKN